MAISLIPSIIRIATWVFAKPENRITVNHANVPNMLGQITKILADHDLNIAVMTNKNRGAWAYTMIDVDSNVGEDVKTALKALKVLPAFVF